MAGVVIILGMGFTGQRLGRRLAARGEQVISPGRAVIDVPKGALMAVTVPPLEEPDKTALRERIHHFAPSRIVYISSTGVYGDQIDVDEDTAANPSDEKGRARLDDETWYAAGHWGSLILRSSAIYGPSRGVHVAIREGRMPRGSGSGVVSRIHVEDLAALTEAALYSDLQGAWPVADEKPCSSAEIAAWLGLKQDGSGRSVTVSGRRVNGQKICDLLGVKLRYATWREGIAASLEEENA